MSLCDNCYAPGQCCKHINFFGGEPQENGSNEVTFWLDEPIQPQMRMHKDDATRPNPFVVKDIHTQWVDKDTQRPYGCITFSCSNLLPNGRCGDYDNRPWLCRVFEPASDSLCVHWRGAEGSE